MRTSKVLTAAIALSIVAGCGDTGGAGGTLAARRPAVSTSLSAPQPSRTPTLESAPSGLPANLLGRIPQFAEAPVPTKVALAPNGTAGWFSRIPTNQKVAFITIDDGWVKHPLALELFRAAGVPTTLFLEVNAIKSDPGYFTALQSAGATIENHTISHPNLKGLSYAAQKREICGGADRLAQLYGRRPILFRPPGGTHDATTLRVAHDCGMKAAFFWKETTDHGKVFFQEGHTVQPGDIILMHFRKRFVDDFLAVLNAIHQAGLTPARLADYLP